MASLRFHGMGSRRYEVDYLKPLSTGDRFIVISTMERRSRLRFIFRQEIQRESGESILRALVTGTVVDPDGKPTMPPELNSLLPEPRR